MLRQCFSSLLSALIRGRRNPIRMKGVLATINLNEILERSNFGKAIAYNLVAARVQSKLTKISDVRI